MCGRSPLRLPRHLFVGMFCDPSRGALGTGYVFMSVNIMSFGGRHAEICYPKHLKRFSYIQSVGHVRKVTMH